MPYAGQNYRTNPRFAEQVKRAVEAKRRALKELQAMYPGVYKRLMEKHYAAINEERGPLPTVVNSRTGKEVRQFNQANRKAG